MGKGTRLAEVVLARRQELRLSQREVLERGGPSNATMTQIENGMARNPSEATLRKLDHALMWEPGSARRVLDGVDPIPLPAGVSGGPIANADTTSNTTEEQSFRGGWRTVFSDDEIRLDVSITIRKEEYPPFDDDDFEDVAINGRYAMKQALDGKRTLALLLEEGKLPWNKPASADAGLSVVEEPYAADEGDRYPGVPGDEDEEMEREP